MKLPSPRSCYEYSRGSQPGHATLGGCAACSVEAAAFALADQLEQLPPRKAHPEDPHCDRSARLAGFYRTYLLVKLDAVRLLAVASADSVRRRYAPVHHRGAWA